MFNFSMTQKSCFHIQLLIITIIIFESLFACLASPKTLVKFDQPNNPDFDRSFLVRMANFFFHFIHDLNSLGDINGDGFDDFFVNFGNEVYIIYGNANFANDTTTIEGSPGFKITSDAGYGSWPFNSVSNAGDLNNDGINDIVIGTSAGWGASYFSAEIFVIYGKRGGNSDIYLPFTESSYPPFDGFRILMLTEDNVTSTSQSWACSAGDINGDKVDDILLRVGDPPGSLYAVYGTASRVDDDVNLTGLTANQGIKFMPIFPGYATEPMNWIGDVNHDGIDDFAVKYFGFSGIPQQIFVVYGRSSNSSDVNFILYGDSIGFKIQCYASIASVKYVGDLNADGIDDFAVSIQGDTDTFNQEPYGTVYIIYGKMGNFADIDLGKFNGSMGFKIQGSPTNILESISISALGDVNNDGFDDFVLGARETPIWVTKAFIIFGQKDRRPNIDLAASENLLLTLNCTMFEFFGTFSKGDLNNDGYNDILIGSAYVIYGLLGSNCNEYTDCNSPMPTICYASKGCDCINEGMMMQDLTCVSSCSPGYYQAADYTCKICSVNCKECSSNQVCKTCFEGYLMQDSLCVSACSTGYTQTGSICQLSGAGDTSEAHGIQLLLIIMGSAVGGGVLVIAALIAGFCYFKRKKQRSTQMDAASRIPSKQLDATTSIIPMAMAPPYQGQSIYLEQPIDSLINLNNNFGAEREKQSIGPEEIELNDQDQACLESQARRLG